MTNKKQFIYWTPFNHHKFNHDRVNNFKIHKTLDPDWIEKRFEFFKEYTYPSMLNQTIQDYQAIFRCDIQTKPQLEFLFGSLKDKRLKLLYMREGEERAFRQSLPDCDIYYACRLDSDDTYSGRAIEEITSYEIRNIFVTYHNGYIWDVNQDLLHHHPRSSQSFFTHIYGPNFKKLNEWVEPPHDWIEMKYPHLVLGRESFILFNHDNNATECSKNITNEVLITNEEQKKQILMSHGINYSFWKQKHLTNL
jgi:hypothetical protein